MYLLFHVPEGHAQVQICLYHYSRRHFKIRAGHLPDKSRKLCRWPRGPVAALSVPLHIANSEMFLRRRGEVYHINTTSCLSVFWDGPFGDPITLELNRCCCRNRNYDGGLGPVVGRSACLPDPPRFFWQYERGHSKFKKVRVVMITTP
jgi:hypothetical protein